MSDKKGLSAFINKNKKTKKPKATGEQADANKEEKVVEAQAQKEQEEVKKNTPAGNDSSDEEVDELDMATKQINYANIKENAQVSAAAGGDEKKHGFGYDDDESAPEKNQSKEKKAGFGQGVQFGKPKFGANKKQGKFGKGDFDAGLDDLDDEGGSAKKEQPKAEGGREFISLGSSAKGAQKPAEEAKEKSEAVKPTFKGKLNLTRTGDGDQQHDQGVVKTYDFRNTYKQARPEGETAGERPREKREGDRDGDKQGRGGKKFTKDRGQAFGAEKKPTEDEGFTVVKKDTRAKKHKKDDDSSSDEEKPKKRGDDGGFRRAEGGRGRGGADRGDRGGFRRAEGGDDFGGARIERRGGNRGGRGGQATTN